MNKIKTPGGTETIPYEDLLASLVKKPDMTLASILEDLHWLLGYAEGMKEMYELRTEGVNYERNEIT